MVEARWDIFEGLAIGIKENPIVGFKGRLNSAPACSDRAIGDECARLVDPPEADRRI